MKWPEEITIPSKVGCEEYFTSTGIPCCAVGMAASEVYGPAKARERLVTTPHWGEWESRWFRVWSTSYFQCASVLDLALDASFPASIYLGKIEAINDSCSPAARKLLYLAAWARLGYVVGMPQDALELAAKADKVYGRIRV